MPADLNIRNDKVRPLKGGLAEANELLSSGECKRVWEQLQATVPKLSHDFVRTVDDGFELRILMRNRRIIFIGDSQSREPFLDLCQHMGGTPACTVTSKAPDCRDLVHRTMQIQHDLRRDPSNRMRSEKVELSFTWNNQGDVNSELWTDESDASVMNRADIFMISGGAWQARGFLNLGSQAAEIPSYESLMASIESRAGLVGGWLRLTLFF